MLCISLVATAQEDEETAAEATATAEEGALSTNQAERGKFVALAIGLGLGIAALGGALGQGRATATVLEGLSRNPGAYDKVFTPFILGMVLIESLVIYSLVISLLLLGKV
jgi:F-type H+-transporting ATPase subunit c